MSPEQEIQEVKDNALRDLAAAQPLSRMRVA
jgi:hypothetical protein